MDREPNTLCQLCLCSISSQRGMNIMSNGHSITHTLRLLYILVRTLTMPSLKLKGWASCAERRLNHSSSSQYQVFTTVHKPQRTSAHTDTHIVRVSVYWSHSVRQKTTCTSISVKRGRKCVKACVFTRNHFTSKDIQPRLHLYGYKAINQSVNPHIVQ